MRVTAWRAMFAIAAGDVEAPLRLARSSGRIEIDARKALAISAAVAVAPAAVLPKSEPSHQAIIEVTGRKLGVVMDKDARVLEGMGCCVTGAAASSPPRRPKQP
jgi:hypothetical protein